MTDPHITDPRLLARMAYMWNTDKLGTLEIAKALGVSEASVYNTLAHRPSPYVRPRNPTGTLPDFKPSAR